MYKFMFIYLLHAQDLSQVLLEVADLSRRPERRPIPAGGTPVPIVALMTECWDG